MDLTLNVTPEGFLSDLPAATGHDMDIWKEQPAPEAPDIEVRGTQSSTTMLEQTEETSYTSVKAVPGRISNDQRARHVDTARRIPRTREASQEDPLASSRCFFAAGNGQNQVVTLELPEEVPNTTIGGNYFRNFHSCHYFNHTYYLHCHHNYWG